MTLGLISVIMPVYNGSKYLREAIDSILNQTYSNFEFIIINDGSTDNSDDIILSYTDNRIIYLKNEINSGICISLNKGLDIAHGEFIARMDSDDIALPTRFKEQVKYLKSHPDIGVLGSDIILLNDNTKDSVFTFSHNKWQCKTDLMFNTCVAHPSVMMRNEIFQKHNIRYNDKFRGIEDYELWWRLSKITHITNIPKPLLKYRIHLNQITKNQNISEKHDEFSSIRLNNFKSILSKEELDLFGRYLTNRLIVISQAEINQFIIIAKKILNNHNFICNNERKALSTNFTHIITNLFKQIGEDNIKHLELCRKLGITSFSLYLKLVIHNILK